MVGASLLAAGLSITGMATGLAKMGFGIADTVKANRMEKGLTTPKYEIPKGLEDYESLMKRNAQGQMPGYDQEMAGIEQGTARTLTGVRQLASNQSSAMAGLLGSTSNQQDRVRELGVRALQYRQQQQQNLGQAYLQRAQAENQQFEYNQWLPWQMKKNQIQSLRGAGTQNIYGGLDSMASAAINGMNMNANQQSYGNMIPQYGNQGQQPLASYPSPYQGNQQAPLPWNQTNLPMNGGFNYNYNLINQ